VSVSDSRPRPQLSRKVKIALAVTAALIVVAVAALWIVRTIDDPDELWIIVQSCVAEREKHEATPACEYVSIKDGVAVIKSPVGLFQYLTIPTVKVTGIEDPQVLSSQSPNYWYLAWTLSGRFLPELVVKHRTEVGLAINSEESRSQNQLHIHMSCMRADVVSALQSNAAKIGLTWSEPMLPFGNTDYRVMRVDVPTLKHVDPFRLVLQVPGAAHHMGSQTLVVTGARWDNGKRLGFYLLEDAAHDTPSGRDTGHGEDLLDENCLHA
jgi:CDP-diacylglycerol pyrophosphatase